MEWAIWNIIAILSSWWRSFCTFFCCLAASLRGVSWSRGASSTLYHDVKTHDVSTAVSPVGEDSGSSITGDDLERGLGSGDHVDSAVSLRPVSSGPTDSSITHELSTPATHSSVLVLTSSVLSPFILEGRGITLSESAKVLLAGGALAPMLPTSFDLAKNEAPLTTSTLILRQGGEGDCGEGGLDPIRLVATSPNRSPSLTTVGASSPAPSSPCFAPSQNIDTHTVPTGATDMLDRGEMVQRDGLSKVTSKPRPPSAVRHSLKFSLSPQALACPPGVVSGQQSVQAAEPALIPPSLSMSHSVATFLSLPEANGVFRGALVTDGDDVHLPSSLSAPEPRYYEFYYDYYCREPVLPLDTLTVDAIRKSLLMLSPVLVVPPVGECDDLSVSSSSDAGNSHSWMLHPQDDGTRFSSPSASPDSWNTCLSPRVPSTGSSISASLFAFPTFPSTSISASTESAGDEGGDEDEDVQLGPRTAFNSPSSSFYMDPEAGDTSGEAIQDPDRTLQTVGELKDGNPGSDSSVSSEGSTIGSDDSLALSGEVTLVHAKRGSLFKPIVLMRVPGTRESIALNMSPPPYSERNLAEVNNAEDASVPMRSPQDRRLTDDYGYYRTSIDSIEEPFTLLSPPTKRSFIGLPKDDEEEEYAASDDESDVEWLSWPPGTRRDVGRRTEGGTDRTRVVQETHGITRSSSHSVTIFNVNHRRTPQALGHTTFAQPHLDALRLSDSASRQIVNPYIQDPRPAKLPECYHSSMESLATLAASPASNTRFSPGSMMDVRSSVVVQMGDSRVPVSSMPQGSLPPTDGLGSLRVSLTASDRRFPTFIPAHVPFPRPRGVPAATVVESDVDHYDEEYESTAGRGLESSGSTSTVKPTLAREEIVRSYSRSKGGDEGESRHYVARHGRQSSGEAETRKPTGYGAPRTFLTYGVDSEDEDVPLRYSGAMAL